MDKILFLFGIIIFILYSSCINWLSYTISPPTALISKVPARSNRSTGGIAFIKKTFNLNKRQRELYIVKEILQGNIPDFLRQLQPVIITTKQNNKNIKAILWVMPDYLAIGSNKDYVRIPMDPVSAQKIADAFGFLIPTTKMVDEIYKSARIKLDPRPLSPGKKMTSSAYYLRHNNIINAQLKNKLGISYLIAGHKKDVVITNKLNNFPYRVAIYGWHRRSNGIPIQPLSIVHSNDYADYSHGIRLVANKILINGQEYVLENVLKDKKLCMIVSYECPIIKPRLHKRYKHSLAFLSP